MLIKYKMVPSANSNDIIADIRGIITGTITSSSGLSASANASATLFYGTYPTDIYATANLNSTADTFSKKHSANSSAVCYFKLHKSSASAVANNISRLSVAQTYNSSTDTLTNYISSLTTEIGTSSYVSNAAMMPIDIIVNDNMFYISQPTNVIPGNTPVNHVAVIDTGYNSYYKTFPYASPFRLFQSYGFDSSGPVIWNVWDYAFSDYFGLSQVYDYSTSGASDSITWVDSQKTTNANNNPILVENPLSICNPATGNNVSIIPKMYAINSGYFQNGAVYTGADGKYRYVICMGTYSFSVLIS